MQIADEHTYRSRDDYTVFEETVPSLSAQLSPDDHTDNTVGRDRTFTHGKFRVCCNTMESGIVGHSLGWLLYPHVSRF